MRLATIMKGGLIACILLSLSVNLFAQGGGSPERLRLAKPSECGSLAVARPPS